MYQSIASSLTNAVKELIHKQIKPPFDLSCKIIEDCGSLVFCFVLELHEFKEQVQVEEWRIGLIMQRIRTQVIEPQVIEYRFAISLLDLERNQNLGQTIARAQIVARAAEMFSLRLSTMYPDNDTAAA